MINRHDVSGLEKQQYVAPEIFAIEIDCEQAIMAASSDNLYGTPGEDPFVNDFGNF